MTPKKSVSIVLPVHNEREGIEEVVRAIYRNVYSKLNDAEFIVAEDGSTDGTKEALEKLAKELPLKLVASNERKGYARAVKDALGLATKEVVFFLDSDGQHKESDFWKLLPFIEDFDIVTGYKCPRSDPAFRLFISRVMNTLIFFTFGAFFRDINSGFKLFRREAIKALLSKYEGMDFISTEFLIKAVLLNLQVAEVPVLHYERQFGESRGLPASKLPAKISKLLFDLLKLRLRLLFGGRI
ncbi:MAG: glycosyltransferase family 2 protein [Candidatus Omnitrophica bacterium]|nr:glycosyltransferase family 2 protein [Candidatus Omnitrophota bacterium]